MVEGCGCLHCAFSALDQNVLFSHMSSIHQQAMKTLSLGEEAVFIKCHLQQLSRKPGLNGYFRVKIEDDGSDKFESNSAI